MTKKDNRDINGRGSRSCHEFVADYLSEVELAAVITYTRQAWGNAEDGDGEIVFPKDIVDYKNQNIKENKL
jgi:cytochrome c oxidase subunit 2